MHIFEIKFLPKADGTIEIDAEDFAENEALAFGFGNEDNSSLIYTGDRLGNHGTSIAFPEMVGNRETGSVSNFDPYFTFENIEKHHEINVYQLIYSEGAKYRELKSFDIKNSMSRENYFYLTDPGADAFNNSPPVYASKNRPFTLFYKLYDVGNCQ